jgi:hypothetical protein
VTDQHASDSLERFATASARASISESRGRCFHATVQLGRQAVWLGIAHRASFVRWTVGGDHDFLEHWALALDDGRLLDATALQVDGEPRAVRSLGEYPDSFGTPCFYPLAVVLDALDKAGHGLPGDDSRVPPEVTWAVHRRMFRHDAVRAMRTFSPLQFGRATSAVLRCAVKLAAGRALQGAIRRQGRLLGRLK